MSRRRELAVGYAWAIGSVALATFARTLLDPVLGDAVPFAHFFVAIAAASVLGGLGPGLFALGLSVCCSYLLFMQPRYTLDRRDPITVLSLILFASAGLIIVLLAEAQRKSKAQAELAARASREALAAERSQREELRTTLASIGDAVIVADREGRVTMLNAVAASLVGWARSEAVGRPLGEIFRIIDAESGEPLDREPLSENVEDAPIGRVDLRARDGSILPIEHNAAPIRDPSGELIGVVMVFRDVTESRKAKLALERSEARFRNLADSMPQIVWILGADGKIAFLNRRWYETTGQPAEISMERLGEAIHPDDRAQVENAATIALRDRTQFESEYRLTDANGDYRWHLARSVTMAGSLPGEVERFGTATDIHDLKLAEIEVEAGRQRLRLALNAARMGTSEWLVGDDRVIWDAQMEQIGGFLPGTFRGSLADFFERIHPDDREKVRDAIGRSIAAQGVYDVEYRVIHPDGSTRWVAASGRIVSDPRGVDERVVGVAHDITARKLAEERSRFLAEAGTTLATLVDERSTLHNLTQLSVPFFGDWCIVDTASPDGSIERLAISHHDPERVQLAVDLRRIYPSDPETLRGPAAVIRTGRTELIEALDELSMGEEHDRPGGLSALSPLEPTSYLCAPIKSRTGVLGSITFLMSDSGRRYRPEDLALAEDLANRAAVALENVRLYAALQLADRHKDEFLATLAHELRNPLAPIKSTLELLGRTETIDAELAESLPMMGRQVGRLTHLVDDLLDVARIGQGKIVLRQETIELAVAARQAIEAVRPLIQERRHELTLQLPDEPIPLKADPTRIEQIFWNLLNNAAKYSDPGGTIGFSIARVGDRAVIRVRDAGCGIAAEMLPRIFEMFVQVGLKEERVQGGLGIGLNLVRSLVELHEGTIEAFSDGPGQGSEFVVSLPITSALSATAIEADNGHDGTKGEQPDSADNLPENPEGPTRRRRILIVDDNVDAAISLKRLLSKLWDQETESRHDGASALLAIDDFRPEIVILDIGMPGMNGYEVAERIRARPDGDSFYLVALTGWGQDDDRRRSREAGFDLHLVKPVGNEAIQPLLEGRRRVARTAPAPHNIAGLRPEIPLKPRSGA